MKGTIMKKSLIYSTTLAAALLSCTAGIIFTTNTKVNATEPTVLAETNNDLNTKPAINTKDETVYAIANSDGTTGSIFVGNNLYTGSETLPVSINIKYYLNDTEISANELKGKSGHIKIVYTYNSETKISNQKVPFLAITSLTLDETKFSNIKLKNGKTINSFGKLLVVGYATPGLNEDFNTTLFPDQFILEADVTNFALQDSYTIFTNDFFKEIDTSKLSSIDGLRSSMNQLADGLNQLIAGASSLSDGLKSLLDGSKKLYTGSQEFATGISSASTGAATISDGLNFLASKNNDLQAGATAIITSTISELAESGVNVTTENYSDILTTAINNYTAQLTALSASPEPAAAETIQTLQAVVAKLTKAKSLLDFATGIIGYTNGVSSAAEGALKLKTGLTVLNEKTPELVNGLATLLNGTEELYNGSVKLSNGLTTIKTSGIDKLVNFANHDLASFTANARAAINAARSYQHFSNESAETVKFIIKTPSIK